MVKMGICQECVFGTGEFGVGEHFRRRQVDRMVGWSSSSYLYLYLHSMVWYVRSLCGKHSVELCMAMEMGTRTRIRNQNLNASQMQLNLKWLESHKRGHLDPRNPAVCSSFFFFMCLISVIVTFMASNSKRFSKRCLHLHVTHFLAPLCWAYPFPEVFVLLFFFFAPGCISNYAKLRAEIITHFGYQLAKVSGLSVASVYAFVSPATFVNTYCTSVLDDS